MNTEQNFPSQSNLVQIPMTRTKQETELSIISQTAPVSLTSASVKTETNTDLKNNNKQSTESDIMSHFKTRGKVHSFFYGT